MATRFTGFPPEAIEFFEDLEMNNERQWFHANKSTYEQACRAPMEALIAELEPEFGAGKIFRINRDTRFSADKTPYKTRISATVEGGYMSLSPDGLYVGVGRYMPDSSWVARFREAVAEDASGKELEDIVSEIERKGYEVWTHDMLKTAPKGYARDHPRIRLLRHKDLGMGKQFGVEP